jgi:hypothetical protein
VSCQAINATGIVSGNVPGGACTTSVQPGDTFELDFSNIFSANGGTLPTDKYYSLQVANLNNGSTNTLTFSNVEFLVSGAIGGTSFTDQVIRIWTQDTPAFPYEQGIGSYTTGGTTGTFTFGNGIGTKNVASQASFTLTGPVANVGLGTAALINTIPINLLTQAGVTSFTGAKIRGTFSSSSNLVDSFSVGLAQFGSSFPTAEQPTAVFGNAFNAVPGPLPIIGAGAAFGWSRRLRRRVNKASTVASVA